MYKIEIFTEKMAYVSSSVISKSQYIELDYLAYDAYTIETQLIDVKKGYFVHITQGERFIADGVVSDVRPAKKTQKISIRPLQSLFDVEVFYTPVDNCVKWLTDNIKAQLINNADAYQNRPITLSWSVPATPVPITDGIDPEATDYLNILSIIEASLLKYNIVTDCYIDMTNLRINVNIYQNTAKKVIEADLENVLESSVTLGDSYGSTNKLVIQKYRVIREENKDPVIQVLGYVNYYLHTDSTINTTDYTRIFPVFWELFKIEYDDSESRYKSFYNEAKKKDPSLTDPQIKQMFKRFVKDDWNEQAMNKAIEVLSPKQYDQEIILNFHKDDLIVTPNALTIGTAVSIILKGETYTSLLTGRTYMGDVTKLTFGAVRTELTKKLNMDRIEKK